jgi:hypothetical protein
MTYSDEQLSSIAFEITDYLTKLMGDVFTEYEKRIGNIGLLSLVFVGTESVEEAAAKFGEETRGIASRVLGSLTGAGIGIEIYRAMKDREIRQLRADLSTAKIESATCELYQLLKSDGFSYPKLLEWADIQQWKAFGPGYDYWAEIVRAINDDDGFWTTRAAMGAARPDNRASVLCVGIQVPTFTSVLYAEHNGQIVPVEDPSTNPTTFRINGTYWDSVTQTRQPIASQTVNPHVGDPQPLIVYRWEYADEFPGYGYIAFEGDFDTNDVGIDTLLYYFYSTENLRWERTTFGVRAAQLRNNLSCQQVSKFGFEPDKIPDQGTNTLAVMLAADPADLPGCDSEQGYVVPVTPDIPVATVTSGTDVFALYHLASGVRRPYPTPRTTY